MCTDSKPEPPSPAPPWFVGDPLHGGLRQPKLARIETRIHLIDITHCAYGVDSYVRFLFERLTKIPQCSVCKCGHVRCISEVKEEVLALLR
jgi:hypothetical protein